MKSFRKHRQHLTDDISGTSQWQYTMICIFMSTLVCLCHCTDLIIIYTAAAAVPAEMYAAARRDSVVHPHIPASSHPFSISHTRVLTVDRYQLASYNLSPDTSANIYLRKKIYHVSVCISVKTQKLVGTRVPVVTASQLYRDMFVGWQVERVIT